MNGHLKTAVSLASENQIDTLCDAFEDEWRRGNYPNIATFLNQCVPTDRSALLNELLLLDAEYRTTHGESVPWNSYIGEFAEFAEQLEAARFRMDFDEETVPSDTVVEPARPRVGARMGRFQLLTLIGTGATGEVWKARDARLQRFVAIKFPHSCDLREPELHRFLREGQTAAQLRHPHIVPVHEVDRVGRWLFIVSDYVAGGSLRQQLDRQLPAIHDTATIAANLADALSAAHSQGIIHRDLKPANILMDRNGQPLIADFGAAKWLTDSSRITVAGELLGTPAYMSPEQIQGNVDLIDARSDVYSLGVILYEMLTGRRPFQGEPAAVMQAVLNKNSVSPRTINVDVPHDLNAICVKAMQKDPVDRYQTANELFADLRCFLEGLPVAASRPTYIRQICRHARRNRYAIVCTCLTGIAVLLVAVAAGKLAKPSTELRGLRAFTIQTVPPGAHVTFVPLNADTGEPSPVGIHEYSGPARLEGELAPGNYLVIAALDDGRFHEVLRHVPKKGEMLSGVFKHNRWSIDARGAVVLPIIEIPSKSITSGMAKIDFVTSELQAKFNTMDSGHTFGRLPTFFIDTHEFSVADYMRANEHAFLIDKRWQNRDRLSAATVSYDEAVATAETIGKRLLTEDEFEWAATAGGQRRFPWGNTPPEAITITADQQVPSSASDFDMLATNPQVWGLCSDVAEWTWSRPHLNHVPELMLKFDTQIISDYRVAKGGNREVIEGSMIVTAASRDPELAVGVSRNEVKPGLGFRCARSSRARTASDFVTPSAGRRGSN